MELQVYLLLLLINCIAKAKEASSGKIYKKHNIAVNSPLILNCTSWNISLPLENLVWLWNDKAWLFEYTVKLNSKIVQLHIPKVTVANNGTYRCCLFNATSSLGVTSCSPFKHVISVGEKPDISNLEPKFKSYGYPPELVNLSWKAVPSNGDSLSYTVSYLACGQRGNFHELKKIASWCTKNSSTSFKSLSFSCDLASEACNCPSNNCDVPNYNLSDFMWNIAVANRFGISESPVNSQNLFIDALCPRPRNVNVKPSGRGSISIKICPPKNVKQYVIDYKVECCPATNQLTSKEKQEASHCSSRERKDKLPYKCVHVKVESLKDGWDYEVSVFCRLVTGSQSYSDLKAGPYRVMTEEQAPDQPPSLPWISLGPSREEHRVANVSFKLPEISSFRGKLRTFIVQYWEADFNQTRMNETFIINETSMSTSAPVSVNITVESAKNYELRVTLCTVACGPWSSVASFGSYKYPQIFNNHFGKQESGLWLKILVAGAVIGTVTLFFIVLVVLCKRRRISYPSPSAQPLSERIAGVAPTDASLSNGTPFTGSTGEYTDDNRTNNDSVSSGDVGDSSPLLESPA